jgi:hypothetical protein
MVTSKFRLLTEITVSQVVQWRAWALEVKAVERANRSDHPLLVSPPPSPQHPRASLAVYLPLLIAHPFVIHIYSQ